MEELELIVVQLQEARNMIRKGRTAHLRLAFILLDSVTELILHRSVQVELWDQELLPQWLYQYKQLAAHGSKSAAVEAELLQERVIPQSQLNKIDRNFDAKSAFLIERGVLDPTLGPVLEKLHKYRNEMYHRDKLRREIIRPATLIYFDCACTVLNEYRHLHALYGPFSTLSPGLKRYAAADDLGLVRHDLPKRISDGLRREVGLDLAQVRKALGDYLQARLDQVRDGLTFLEDNLGLRDLVPGDALRLVQANLTPKMTLEQVRGRKYPYSKADLERWQSLISALESIGDKHQLVRDYAYVEDSFEPFERQVEKAVLDLDREIVLREEFARGK
ncbi:hypothetical protein ACPYPG_17580 [Streptomyces sp. FR-108]|uniref:hypothetical protein n=1 Tax=Streptomyces sp. FR-108 TaxID=3416665 RepID=UPI003CEFBB1E